MKIYLASILIIVAIIIALILIVYQLQRAHDHPDEYEYNDKIEVKSENLTPDENSVLIEEILEVSYKDGSLYINGKKSPDLFFLRNKYYEFRNPTKEPIYITTRGGGGPGMPNPLFNRKVDGLIEGSLILKTGPEVPDIVYYQSSLRKNAGSKITLV